MIETRGFVPFAVPDIGDEEIDAVVEAMRSGWLTTGPRVAAFEQEFATRIGGAVEAIAVNSATAGLHLALEALGVGPGDEVIVPTWTFTATAEVVRYLGADPVLVDVDPVTLNLDLAAAEAAVSARTRAILPVHFAGLPVSRKDLEQVAVRQELHIVEDAAHAFPCVSGGLEVGRGASEAVVFSFYATKTMTTGEGGMVVTADGEIAARLRTMRLHGISRDVFNRYRSTSPAWHYEVVAPGFKYNLTDPAAALGRVQLARADDMRDRRAAIAARYDDAFAELPVQRPAGASDGDVHAWHLYVLRVNDEGPITRNALIDRLAAAGVGSSVHFIPLHQQPYWRDTYGLRDGQFPVASREFQRAISLPLFSSMTDSQVEQVTEAVVDALQ